MKHPLHLVSALGLSFWGVVGILVGCSGTDLTSTDGGQSGGTGGTSGSNAGAGKGGSAGHAGGATTGAGKGGGAPAGGSTAQGGSGGDSATNGGKAGGGKAGQGAAGSSNCTGEMPLCFGTDPERCCVQDPYPSAVCRDGQWLCAGTADNSWITPPGCDGQLCYDLADGGAAGGGGQAGERGNAGQAGAGAGGQAGDGGACSGEAPLCFGSDVSQCCGNDPAGRATCTNGSWLCFGAPAPGCNGESCL